MPASERLNEKPLALRIADEDVCAGRHPCDLLLVEPDPNTPSVRLQIADCTLQNGPSRTFARVIEEFRSRLLILYTPRGVETRGWHEIDVRLRRREETVRARRGYIR